MNGRLLGAAALLGAAVALSACSPEDVVVATLQTDAAVQDEPPPGNGGCTSNDDCDELSFCAKSSCKDATGACQLRPAECDGAEMRVCGCEGVTYWNSCLSQQAGSASYVDGGECRVGAAMCTDDGGSCPVAGSSCARLVTPPFEMCMPDLAGTCWVLPPSWIPCTGSPPGEWTPCDPPGPQGPMCTDMCGAIRSGVQSHPIDPSQCHDSP